MKEKIEALTAELDNIEKRMAAGEVTDPTEAENLGKRSADIINERANLIADLQNQARSKFNEGSKINMENKTPEMEIVEKELNKDVTKRDKISAIGGYIRNAYNGKTFKELPLAYRKIVGMRKPNQERAVGVALTTTSDTFVEADAVNDGVNNAGVFIKTSLILSLLELGDNPSAVLADLNFTQIPGLLSYPIKLRRDKAKAKAEGDRADDNQIEWGTVELKKGNLFFVIRVTDEVFQLSDFDFGSYIVREIARSLSEDWLDDILYGTGANNHIEGITVGAGIVNANYTAVTAAEDALIEGIKKIPSKYRNGIKIYVAQDIYDAVYFAKDDNGNFKHPIVNNSVGLGSFGSYPIQVETGLKAGDFIIGNLNRYFLINLLSALRIELDRLPRLAATDYVSSTFAATGKYPGAIAYGKKGS